MKRFLFAVVALFFAVGTLSAAPKPKATLTGTVTCTGVPVAGVAVSDGEKIVLTDVDGKYAISSTKPYGTVFISIPSGYEPAYNNNILPRFWATTTQKTNKREVHDFALTKVDNSKFAFVFSADTHLCNDPARNDLEHFRSLYIPAVKKACESVGNTPVYSAILGDIGWERFWYSQEFGINKVRDFIVESGYPVPLYTVSGNHDNDPSVPYGNDTDNLAAIPYRQAFGPSFYSMNIGGVHFLMLDNIVFKNEYKDGGKKYKGVVGSRNYDCYVSEEQLDWIKKDLALIDKSTPIVVCMHANLLKRSHKTGAVSEAFSNKELSAVLIDMLKDYASVRVFTGHHHSNLTLAHPDHPNIVEYNIASVAGELWNTLQHSDKNICLDGSPAGFLLCTFDNGNFSAKFCPEQGTDADFRAYDSKSLADKYKSSKKLQYLCELHTNQTDYSTEEYGKYLYINCWRFMPDGSADLKVTASDGTELAIERVNQSDPLVAELYYAPYMAKKKKANKRYNRLAPCHHLYRVDCSDTTGDITIRSGNIVKSIASPVVAKWSARE